MKSNKAVTVAEVRKWLEAGQRVALYIRHAERPPIDPDDPTFGMNLDLTDKGRSKAVALGAALKGAATGARLWASPMTRTRATVRAVAEGAGLLEGVEVADAGEIGVYNVFSDPVAAYRQMGAVGIMPYLIDYFEQGKAVAAVPIVEATAGSINWIERVATAPLNLFGSHDVTVGAALTGLGLCRVDAEKWVPFLTGIALVESAGGWERHWLHDPEFAHHH